MQTVGERPAGEMFLIRQMHAMDSHWPLVTSAERYTSVF